MTPKSSHIHTCTAIHLPEWANVLMLAHSSGGCLCTLAGYPSMATAAVPGKTAKHQRRSEVTRVGFQYLPKRQWPRRKSRSRHACQISFNRAQPQCWNARLCTAPASSVGCGMFTGMAAAEVAENQPKDRGARAGRDLRELRKLGELGGRAFGACTP